MRYQSAVLNSIALFLLCGCAPNAPYRTGSITCTDPGAATAVCATASHEATPSYDLLFAEFDDQGLSYPEARSQADTLMSSLKTIGHGNEERVAVYVFVHGWKNNAAEDNDNVQNFRKMLAVANEDELSAGERLQRKARRVIGIYVGWRGLATNVEPFDEMSFWTRKSAAERVAYGSVRALFAKLKLYQCKANGNAECSLTGAKMAPEKNVRLILIGHSFGALILYNAVSEALMESLIYDDSVMTAPPPVPRFGDMVILLNPAFEASRYIPLQLLTKRPFSGNEPPIFVSITSTADWATGDAFPIGRSIDAIFERKSNSPEDAAITHTMGHIDDLITHKLTKPKDAADCRGWLPVFDIRNTDDRERQIHLNRHAEDLARQAFKAANPILKPGWERNFCGGGRLTQVSGMPNSPIWNIQTDRSLVPGHSDIMGEPFVAVMRQLSSDTLFDQ